MDHYAALGLKPGASIKEIRTQFRRLAMVFHPDRNNDDAWCREQLMRLNASYEFLLDAARNGEGDALGANSASQEIAGQPAVSARRAGSMEALRRDAAYNSIVSPPSPLQRILLSALFCVALLGAVAVIGALIGEGQPSNDSAPPAVANSYYPPAAVPAGPSYAPSAASSGSDRGFQQVNSSQRGWIAPAEPVDYAPADSASAGGIQP